MRRGLCGSVFPSGCFPDFSLLSFMPAGPQAEHPREWQGHGACLFPLQICRLRLPLRRETLCPRSHGGCAFRLLRGMWLWRWRGAALLFSSLLSSHLLLSAGAFLRPRAASPGRSAAGKPAGRPYGEAPHGRSRLLSCRISRGRELSCEPSPSLLIFRLTSFSASSGGSGSRQGQRSVCRPC